MALLAAEVFLEIKENSALKSWENQLKPCYPWSFVTRDGARISKRKGYLKLRHFPALVYDNFPNQHSNYFNISAEGFRGEMSVSDAISKNLIAVVGGSTAFGTGLSSDQETFAEQLQSSVVGTPVINAAVIGYTAAQEYLMYLTRVSKYKPSILISLGAWNNFSPMLTDSQQWAPHFGTFDEIENQLRSHYYYTHPKFWVRIPYGTANLFFPKIIERTLNLWKQFFGNQIKRPTIEALAEEYAKDMEKISAETALRGTKFLAVLQLDRRSFIPNDQKEEAIGKLYNSFRALAKVKMEQVGIPFLDLHDFESKFSKEVFFDHIHLDALGNKMMAEIVLEKLK